MCVYIYTVYTYIHDMCVYIYTVYIYTRYVYIYICMYDMCIYIYMYDMYIYIYVRYVYICTHIPLVGMCAVFSEYSMCIHLLVWHITRLSRWSQESHPPRCMENTSKRHSSSQPHGMAEAWRLPAAVVPIQSSRHDRHDRHDREPILCWKTKAGVLLKLAQKLGCLMMLNDA